MIVLDTNALIWLTTARENLSAKASKYIEKGMAEENVFISSFSIWEVALLAKKKRLNIKIGFDRWLTNVKEMSSLKIAAIDADIAESSVWLEWEHNDPADRIIVATALSLNCPLVTSDQKLLDCKLIKTIW